MRFRRFSAPCPARISTQSGAWRVSALGVVPALLLSLGAGSGCAAKAKSDAEQTNAPDESNEDSQSAPQGANPNLKALRVDDLRCAVKGQRADQRDLNQDGRSDLVSLYGSDGITLSCRQADFNFDGRHDAYFHYDEKGVLVREQFDLDYDGRIDIGRTFRDGKLVLDEQDTNRDGFVDAWRRYDKGRLLRIETDRDGDGRADMFAYYVAGRVDRIGYDVNGDGRVDQWDHDAARRAREAEAIRKENTAPADMPGAGTEEFVDEGAEGSEGEEGAPRDTPKPATSAPERTGGDSLKPKAGAGETPTVEAGEAKSLDGGNEGGGTAAKPAKPSGGGAPVKPQKPGVQKPGG
ncbi:MAG: hypothetical protein ACE37F_12540 [Nannocystaceae bacterium]|nr:hypothetical protein [bacterium]